MEVDIPRPGSGEVLVRVAATSINAVDRKLRSGMVTKLGPPPFTLGFDLSGAVTEVGASRIRPSGYPMRGALAAHTVTRRPR